MLQGKAVCGPWFSVSRENCQSILDCCITALSTRAWRFWYIVFASGSLNSRMDRSIMVTHLLWLGPFGFEAPPLNIVIDAVEFLHEGVELILLMMERGLSR